MSCLVHIDSEPLLADAHFNSSAHDYIGSLCVCVSVCLPKKTQNPGYIIEVLMSVQLTFFLLGDSQDSKYNH